MTQFFKKNKSVITPPIELYWNRANEDGTISKFPIVIDLKVKVGDKEIAIDKIINGKALTLEEIYTALRDIFTKDENGEYTPQYHAIKRVVTPYIESRVAFGAERPPKEEEPSSDSSEDD